MISIVRLIDALGVTDEAFVPKLELWKDAALSFIETQTRRYFGPVTATTEWYRGNGTRSLWLNAPATVDEDNELTVNEYSYPGAAASEIIEDGSNGYELRTHGSDVELLRTGSGGVWTYGYDYGITYSRGYVEDTGPKDIEELLIELVRLRYDSENVGEVLKSETIGGYSFTRFDSADVAGLPPIQQATLEAKQRPVFA